MSSERLNPAYRIIEPTGTPVPVVFDSPHSGSIYPADFGHILDPMLLRQAEDAHIDELFAPVAAMGAPLLHALFPRSYIDANRAETDIDLSMIAGDWPDPVAPSTKTTERGAGLIWKLMRGEGALYDRKLTVVEVRHRIDTYWRPYHDALARLIDDTHARHGISYHVDCHSMPAMGDANSEDGPVARPDFIVGDRDGTACEPGFTALIAAHLKAEGYHVTINDPYKGVELTRRYSNAAAGRHSLQLEINRRLFMDEATLAKTPGYLEIEAVLTRLNRAIVDYAKAQAV